MHLLLNRQLLWLRSKSATSFIPVHFIKWISKIALPGILLLLAVLPVYAQQVPKVTIHMKNATVAAVFERITNHTGYVFFYDDKLIDKKERISVDADNESLDLVLKRIFAAKQVDFLFVNKTIAIKKKSAAAKPVSFMLQGKVIDATTGQPLPGVGIRLKNEPGGVVSNDNGVFAILVYRGAVLSFSSLGYEGYEEEAKAEYELVIRLQPAIKEMKAQVVTGIYTRKKDSYTGSVLTITNEEMRKLGNANVFQALRNISPSMFLDNFALGSSPNALPNMQMRGTSTLGNLTETDGATLKGNYIKSPNEPLFILDGFEATAERIFDLDINRIESVTLLKDAAAKAIYGSRAANGVVVLETKKTSMGKTLITYNASVDVELPDLSSYNLTNSLEKLEAEKLDGMYTARFTSDVDGELELQQLYQQRRKLALEGLNTDWISKPLRNGIGTRHTVGVELGGNDLRLMADFAYRDEQGVMKGSGRKNVTANMNGSYRVKKLLFRNMMSFNSNKGTESPYGKFGDYVKMNPYWKAVNADGTIPFLAEAGIDQFGMRYTNPVFNSTINTNITSDYLNFTDNFYLEWTVKPGLRAIARAGVDVKSSGADEFYPAAHTSFAGYNINDAMMLLKGAYTVNNGKSTYLSGDFNVNYSKNIGRHTIFSNVGFNINERKFSEIMHTVRGFASDRMENILLGRGYMAESKPTGVDGLSREIGFLGAFSYMYDSRFMTDLTLRRSASSLFGSDKKWGNFWSAGIGWNLHNESIFRQTGLFEQFKIRGSVGATGNPNFSTNAAVASYKYYLESFYQGLPGSYLMNLANSALQWESKLDYNAGADIRIKGLNLRFDYYESYTQNLVAPITVPNSTGFSSVSENLGKVKNQGVEVYATYMLYQKGRNYVTLNLGLETNKNRIISLSNAMKSYNDNMDLIAKDNGTGAPVKKYVDGMSMNAIWAVPSRGIDPSTGNEIYVKKDGSTTYNWDPLDMVVVGNSLPDYQGTFGISAEYKRIGVTLTGRYLGGGDLYNNTLVDRVENVDMTYNVDRRVLSGRWKTPGQIAEYKRLGNYTYYDEDGDPVLAQMMTKATSRFVQQRNELSLAAVNVYYYISDAFAKRLRMQQLKLAFNMNELGTFSTIRLERGTEYPFSRTLSFSLSATF